MHQFVHLVQFAQATGLVRGLYEAPPEEFDGLSRVTSVTDVGTLDGDHLDDGLEDWCTEIGTGWETDGNNCAAGSDVLIIVS